MRLFTLSLLLWILPGQAQTPGDPSCADAESCLSEGLRLAEGTTAVADAARSTSLLRLGCGKGSDLACAYAEVMQAAYGEPGASRAVSEVNAGRAREQLAAHCSNGTAQACYLAGVAAESGLGMTPDPGAALRFYGDACGGNVARACYREAQLLESGPMAWRDPAQADELYRQACKGDEPRACFDLATRLSAGTAPVSEGVAQLFERGCTGKHMASCTALAKLHLAGRAPNSDVAEAKRLLDKACKGGDAEACKLR